MGKQEALTVKEFIDILSKYPQDAKIYQYNEFQKEAGRVDIIPIGHLIDFDFIEEE